MDKIIVIGCPGSGKSTFSKVLHKLTAIPLFHLDMMYWNSDKTTVDSATFFKRLSDAIQHKRWIIDGNYASTMEIRMRECDTVFFLDFPTDICLSGVRERQGKLRSDMPWTDDEDDFEFIEFIKKYNEENRPRVLELLERYTPENIFIFKSRAEADEFLENIQKKLPKE